MLSVTKLLNHNVVSLCGFRPLPTGEAVPAGGLCRLGACVCPQGGRGAPCSGGPRGASLPCWEDLPHSAGHPQPQQDPRHSEGEDRRHVFILSMVNTVTINYANFSNLNEQLVIVHMLISLKMLIVLKYLKVLCQYIPIKQKLC